MVSTVEKGNKLEDKFFNYLIEQQKRKDFVCEAHPPELCKIYQKKRYMCSERKREIEFDVVIELYRKGGTSPYLHILFECKNHKGSIPERDITDFSDKVGRLFQHANKAVLVTSSRLQSGARNIAENRKIGIVKFNEHGFEVVADRKSNSNLNAHLVNSQLFNNGQPTKSLKFSALHDGQLFGTIDEFLQSLDPVLSANKSTPNNQIERKIPFLSQTAIEKQAYSTLEKIDYQSGPVDIERLCSELEIDLSYKTIKVKDEDGNYVLGSANFDRKSIEIYRHHNLHRERFTIAHEIGHFCLRHDRYLRAESIIDRNLFIQSDLESTFPYEKLEFHANAFASELLLPKHIFREKTAEIRNFLNIRDRGHGYIYVDEQPCNYVPYLQLRADLSEYFEVSKQAIDIRLQKLGLLADRRASPETTHISDIIAKATSISRTKKPPG